MSHQDYKEMLVPQALTALDHEEEQALEFHLAACSECREELDEWRENAAAISLTALPVEPSPQLRARIIESARAERKHLNSGPTSNIIRLPKLGMRRRPWLRSWGTLAAALAFLAILAAVFVLWKQNNAAKAELARLSNQVEENRQELAGEREAVDVLTTPGARIAELMATPAAPGAHATLAYDGRTGRAVLLARGLPQVPAGKAYQLWFIAGSQPPMPGGVFTTDSSGNATLRDHIPAVALNAAVFAITLEPAGGVKAPSGQMYLKSAS